MRLLFPFLIAAIAFCGGCSDPEFDTSTPQNAMAAMREMIEGDRADLLPTMIHVQPREITFDDGVTEESAIGNVREKMGDMLGQLWRVTKKLRDRYPTEVQKELSKAASNAGSFSEFFQRILTNPFAMLDEQSGLLAVEDLGDGTAAVTYNGEPAFGGALTMIETNQGWRFNVPTDLVQSSEFWPQTRHEWSVMAYMMLGIENSLSDFERELDSGKYPSLAQASERAGRLIGESVAAQSIIYYYMKQGEEKKPGDKPGDEKKAG
jgi:hypothetical protein